MAAGSHPPAGWPSAAARSLGALAAGLTLALGATSGVSFETQFLRAGLAGVAFAVLGWVAGTAFGFVATARPAAPVHVPDGEAAPPAAGRGKAAAGPAGAGPAGSGGQGRGRVMDVLVEDDGEPDARRN